MPELPASQSTVANDMELAGFLTYKGQLSFAGKLTTGRISGGSLFVGKSAVINGDLMVGSVRVVGTVFGNISAMDKCELGESAGVTGDVSTSRIVLAEGATLVGQMEIGPCAAELKPKPAAPATDQLLLVPVMPVRQPQKPKRNK